MNVRQEQNKYPAVKTTDFTASGNSPTIYDVWTLLVEVNESLAEVKRQQKEHASAFLKNDIDEPDFDGHRRSHTKLIKSDKILKWMQLKKL
jgi:hypothetical protein